MAHRPPRPTSATPASQQNQQLASLADGYARISDEGEVHVGRQPSSVVYRKRKVSAQPLGRTTPMIPDGRYTLLPKEFTFGTPNKQDAEHAGTILHNWEETAPPQQKTQQKKIAVGLHHSNKLQQQQRSSSSNAESYSVSIRGGKQFRTIVTDPARMRPAGIASGVRTPECRFAHAIGSAPTPTHGGHDLLLTHNNNNNNNNLSSTASSHHGDEGDAQIYQTSASRHSARANNVNVIGSGMGNLIAHDYRYAWVAQKMAEHEELVHRENSSRNRIRGSSPAPSSSSQQQQQHQHEAHQVPHYQLPQKRAASAEPSATMRARSASVDRQRNSAEYCYDDSMQDDHFSAEHHQQQQQNRNQSVLNLQEQQMMQGRTVIGPSGRMVTRYPKLVGQRVAESNTRATGDRLHPKEYFTMKQFTNVPSRYAGVTAHAFAKGGGMNTADPNYPGVGGSGGMEAIMFR